MRWSAILVLLFAPALAGCASSRLAPLEERFSHRVPFEVGHAEVVDGNAIVIEEVWGTRPRIEVGGAYVVKGTYRLAADEGTVFLYETANGWDNSGPVIDTQQQRVRRGGGRFTLVHEMPGPGYLHVLLHTRDGREVADLYFGHDGNLLVEKSW